VKYKTGLCLKQQNSEISYALHMLLKQSVYFTVVHSPLYIMGSFILWHWKK